MATEHVTPDKLRVDDTIYVEWVQRIDSKLRYDLPIRTTREVIHETRPPEGNETYWTIVTDLTSDPENGLPLPPDATIERDQVQSSE